MPWADATYRGRLVVRATARGTVHVINRVGLEDYLKGVVPAEMGPRVYDELEALKAQAVAARSYAAKHRGQFAAEGYDLCATPRCQVYSGAGAENALSTRAVEETAGEVLLWKGAVADALFTSTCGGRTENAPDVMSGYAGVDAPYLASVPCFGETPQVLESSAPVKKGTITLLGARGRALAESLGGGDGAKISQKAREAVRLRLGLAASGAPKPHPLSVPAVYTEIAAAAGFDTGVLVDPTEAAGLPAQWSEKARASFAALQRFQLGGGSALPTDRALKPEEVAGIYAVLLSRMGDFEDVEGRITKRDEAGIEVKSRKRPFFLFTFKGILSSLRRWQRSRDAGRASHLVSLVIACASSSATARPSASSFRPRPRPARTTASPPGSTGLGVSRRRSWGRSSASGRERARRGIRRASP